MCVLRSDMFLKSFLGLAVCFQAFFIGNSEPKTIYNKVPGGLEVGKVLKVHVWDPVIYPEVKIRLYIYRPSYPKTDVDTELVVKVSRRTGEVEIYTLKGGKEHNHHDFYLGNQNSSHNITVQILMEKNYFDIITSGKQFYLYHLTPIEPLSAYDVMTYDGSQSVTAVWETQFVQCPCGLQKTHIRK